MCVDIHAPVSNECVVCIVSCHLGLRTFELYLLAFSHCSFPLKDSFCHSGGNRTMLCLSGRYQWLPPVTERCVCVGGGLSVNCSLQKS